MAILSALAATVLLAGLGFGLALLGIEESMLAGHDRGARALRLASESASRIAFADLRRPPSWTSLPGLASRMSDTSLRPPAPWGGPVLDLTALTLQVQAETDARRSAGEAPRVWRLFASGPFAGLAPGSGCGPFYLVVWVADDGADTDGDPASDSNGILTVRADALGPDRSRATTLLTVMRSPVPGEPDRIRILTVRPGP